MKTVTRHLFQEHLEYAAAVTKALNSLPDPPKGMFLDVRMVDQDLSEVITWDADGSWMVAVEVEVREHSE